ncbi:MAG: hypothetical protein HY537_06165 [Deltaproteobacteria bacterium]|nr:hypothetical protein [Deltaproteobacteria bacterium]
MNGPATDVTEPQLGMIHPDFESLVQRMIQAVDKERLAELRKDFHTRLRITLTQPDDSEVVQDLWDFFYDWCIFEQKLPETVSDLRPEEQLVWRQVKGGNLRGLYTVQRSSASELKLKELYSGKTYAVVSRRANDFVGISKGDIIEGRLLGEGEPESRSCFRFVRKPSYHPPEIHTYIKKKIRQFRRSQDYSTYQTWLWLLVGMYLKHRIYRHMPIDKIYDDNSRI